MPPAEKEVEVCIIHSSVRRPQAIAPRPPHARTKEERESLLLGVSQVDGPIPQEEARERNDGNVRCGRGRIFAVGRAGGISA